MKYILLAATLLMPCCNKKSQGNLSAELSNALPFKYYQENNVVMINTCVVNNYKNDYRLNILRKSNRHDFASKFMLKNKRTGKTIDMQLMDLSPAIIIPSGISQCCYASAVDEDFAKTLDSKEVSIDVFAKNYTIYFIDKKDTIVVK